MSKKSDLKRAIQDSEREIEELEKKRSRSQAALFAAMLQNQKPNATDSEYFKSYSQLIELERENMRKCKEELEELEKAGK